MMVGGGGRVVIVSELGAWPCEVDGEVVAAN